MFHKKLRDVQPGCWFTADLWLTENSPDEFLALNAHCMDVNLRHWMFTLGLQSFDERRTMEEIFGRFVLFWIEWGFCKAYQTDQSLYKFRGETCGIVQHTQDGREFGVWFATTVQTFKVRSSTYNRAF